MKQTWKDLFCSKKFWLTVVGAGVCAGLHAAGASDQVVAIVGSLFGVNVLGQGMSDFGKNRPR